MFRKTNEQTTVTDPSTKTDGVVERPLVSVVMPCLNEEDAIGFCIEKIQKVFERENILGEIVVCDNGSDDRSVEIAQSLGARVVHQPRRGYGNAYIKGIDSAQGEYIVMGTLMTRAIST